MSFPEPPPRPDDEPTQVLGATGPAFGPAEALDSRPDAARTRRTVVTAALAVLGLAAAGVVGAALVRGGDDQNAALAAASSTPTASSSADPDGDGDGHRGFHRGGRFGGPGLMGLAGALHGELVVPDGNGGYRTVVVQRGKATAVGSGSITVQSEDNYTRTYDVPAGTGVNARRDGLGSITTGAAVVVMADKKGSSYTATQVIDLDQLGRGLPGLEGGMRLRGGPGLLPGPDETPVPAPSGSTEGSSADV